MEVLPAEGSNSSDGMKDTEKASVKMNGDVNGSMEGMEVDEDSQEGGSDESVCGSSRVNMPDDDSKPNSHFESEGESKSFSHFESEGEGKSNSHFGSEFDAKSGGHVEAMDVDGLGDGDGESVGSEEEDHLLNSDNEREESVANEQPQDLTQNDPDEETEEEGDINEEPSAEVELKKPIEKVNNNASEGGIDDDSDPIEGDREDGDEEDDKDSDSTPKKKKIVPVDLNVAPRRSSRTVQKPVRFGQEELEMDSEDDLNDSDGIEEVQTSDPLADPLIDKENHRYPRMIGNTTIVVSDAKRLSDIAAQRSATPQQKKEPTLVIIDTNSILAGRGSVPLQTPGGVTITQQPAPQKPQLQQQPNYPPKSKPPPILPTLTDDMYVVEAPSFIVPYVYEKPPVKKLTRYLRKMLKQIRKQEDEKRDREDKEDAEAEAAAAAAATGVTVAAPGEEAVADAETKLNSVEAVKEKDDVDKTDKSVKENELKIVAEDENKMDVDKPVEDEGKEEKLDEKINDDVTEVDKTNNMMATEKKESENVVKTLEIRSEEEKKPEEKKTSEKTEGEESSESEDDDGAVDDEKKKPSTGSYFSNPLGKFFMQIGMNLVQEFVQADLLKQQKKKQKMGKGTEETQAAIASLKKNLQLSKENNEPYAMEQTKCEFCSFKTESKLVMAHHLETPHMRNYVYRCNFCPLEVRGPHDILLHMEAEHCVRGRLERAPAFHQCPQCPFEDNQKGKLTRHLLTCAKKFRPEKNLEPPLDWEPPAKIPRVPRKPASMPLNVNSQLYQQAMAAKNIPPALLPKMGPGMGGPQSPMMRPRGRPSYSPVPSGPSPKMMANRAPMPPSLTRANMMYRPPSAASPVVLPGYQISGNQLFQVVGAQGSMMNVPGAPPALQRLGSPVPPQQKANPTTVKLLNQPSISITPLPRQSGGSALPGTPPAPSRQPAPSTSKTTFVICEICDGYIKDLEQLRNHMQWIHKVKIHPKMIYNRPPLNCQKCQFRFFTDQGLERHLLGSHGLVTSSMQDSANKGKDGGRCPVCGRVYQWKLLNHVARDHNMTLKPAHLSYKCTVCTATFGMYKQFESHVYSAHSVVAKRVMDKKNGQAPPPSQAARPDPASLLKPYNINKEITIIPQPAKKAQTQQQRPARGNYQVGGAPPQPPKPRGPDSVQIIDLEDSPNKHEEGGAESLSAVKERLRRRKSLEIRQLESEPEGSESDDHGSAIHAKPSEPEDEQDSEPESDG